MKGREALVHRVSLALSHSGCPCATESPQAVAELSEAARPADEPVWCRGWGSFPHSCSVRLMERMNGNTWKGCTCLGHDIINLARVPCAALRSWVKS